MLQSGYSEALLTSCLSIHGAAFTKDLQRMLRCDR